MSGDSLDPDPGLNTQTIQVYVVDSDTVETQRETRFKEGKFAFLYANSMFSVVPEFVLRMFNLVSRRDPAHLTAASSAARSSFVLDFASASETSPLSSFARNARCAA